MSRTAEETHNEFYGIEQQSKTFVYEWKQLGARSGMNRLMGSPCAICVKNAVRTGARSIPG